MTELWKYFFKTAKCSSESIAEVERLLVAKVNQFDKYS